jgi:hypothetical protein
MWKEMTTKGHGDQSSDKAATEIVVFSVSKDTRCAECGCDLWKGSLLRVDREKALCLDCADLDHLEFLPSGDAAVTRRASKYSPLRAVVVKWSRARKRYERQGILVDADAIGRAEEESLADAEVRARRQERAAERRVAEDREFVAAFAAAIRAHFPSCPAGSEAQIAEHACRKYSGRVGRTAAAKALSPEAIRLAVIAHIRHVHTNYDALLGRFGDRESARSEVREKVADIVGRWEQG